MNVLELKPCPLCGNKAKIYFHDYIGDTFAPYYSIECTNEVCGCCIDVNGERPDAAILKWNTRV